MAYNFKKLEKKWPLVWQKKKIFEPDLQKARHPFYNLMMFPYPSAEGLHIGSVRTFTGVDIYGRMKRMQGKDVFEPIGLDGFGIHSENYAIKIGKHPAALAKKTEKNFYRQLAYIGNGFAWNERLETYDPEYYRWTQWLFVQMFKRGLAYRKKAAVNWCPSCLTVLADEQALSGECERCGTAVVKKELEQWFFKITDYAERLLQNLGKLDWTENIKLAQRNWIGKSDGALITFEIRNSKFEIEVFTTRPDTLFGATYLVLAPEHPVIEHLKSGISNLTDVEAYAAAAKKKSEIDRIAEGREKTGVKLEGARAINPASGEEIPIFVADYVLGNYGTGAIMAVPAHDERDFQFAKKFDLPLRLVIAPLYGEANIKELEKAYTGIGYMVNSGEFNGMQSDEAKKAITDFVGGRLKTTYRLRDWLISRQRYWGPPIPLVFCEHCAEKIKNQKSKIKIKERFNKGELENPGWIAVPEKDLPVKLPFIKNFRPKGTGFSPLASDGKFLNVRCPRCGNKARRETDVSDTFLDSAWYFLAYLGKENSKFEIQNSKFRQRAKRWLPVHMYIGGAEHAVLHLLYARFITMAMHDFGFLDFEEPFSVFRAHGLITKDGAKMSKSKGNIVSPDAYFKKYGADAMRMYLAFLAPLTEGGDFRDAGISGMTRFLNRIVRFVGAKSKEKTAEHSNEQTAVQKILHQTIKKVTEDIEALRYNTAISALMILLRAFEEQKGLVTRKDCEVFVKLLAPFAPFLSEELYQELRGTKPYTSVHAAPWPQYNVSLLQEETYALIIQINGKVRDHVDVPADISQKDAEMLTKSRIKIKPWIEGKNIEKVIFVPKRLINFVVR